MVGVNHQACRNKWAKTVTFTCVTEQIVTDVKIPFKQSALLPEHIKGARVKFSSNKLGQSSEEIHYPKG
mgnify:CR=1 FL=1